MKAHKISKNPFEICSVISIYVLFAGLYFVQISCAEVSALEKVGLEGIRASANPVYLAQNRSDTIAIRVTNILDKNLPSKVSFRTLGNIRVKDIELPGGVGGGDLGEGQYRAYTYVYENDVPLLIDIRDVVVEGGVRAELLVSLLEGSGGNRKISAFDQDYDLAIDRVELEAGTDPGDAKSVPGEAALIWPSRVLSEEGGWYRGELHAHSRYGRGSESVAKLIRRAEKMGLDFLAITDLNTLASAEDEDYHSDSVVLIPAMEWGDDERGRALIYAPGTFPTLTSSYAEAQAMVIRVQAQGGIFAIAHPNFPLGTWQWGLDYPNAIEAWCRGWREIPPMTLEQLDERWKRRVDGRLVYPIAVAAATNEFTSANSQSTLFWDMELSRGVKTGVIAGSNSTSPRVPLAAPVTYVYGREKSLQGILEGLRMSRTFVSKGLDGPRVEIQADILNDGSIEVGMGGIIPINRPSRLIIAIDDAEGARMDLLSNGRPIASRVIEGKRFLFHMEQTPEIFAVYRVRVVKAPEKMGYGVIDVLAMSSPIYAQGYVVDDVEDAESGWIDLENNYQEPTIWEGGPAGDPREGELRVSTP